MSSRAIVMAIVLVVVGFTFMSVREYFTSAPEVQVVQPTAPRILVAKRNLISGTFIQIQEDFDWQPAPASAQTPAPTTENQPEATGDNADVEQPSSSTINPTYQYEGSVRVEDFNGAVVRRAIRAGDPIFSSMLMKPGEGGFMSAVLEPGKRAVSISVNPISGNAGFVSPGDRVDLLVTYHVKNGQNTDSGQNDSISTETFAHNVRVLAVDQSLDNPENKAILAKTITVEVTPIQAEKISVASEMGKISLALVSISTTETKAETPAGATQGETTAISDVVKQTTENANSFPKKYTVDGDVSSLLGEKESATSKVRIIRGDKIETLEFYQDK